MFLSKLSLPIRNVKFHVIRKEVSSAREIIGKVGTRYYSTTGDLENKSNNQSPQDAPQSKSLPSSSTIQPVPRTGNRRKSTVDSLLHDIPIGGMNRENLKLCRHKIHVFSQDNTVKGAARAENLLKRLTDEAIATSQEKADLTLFNLCLGAWAKSGHVRAFMACRRILDSMTALHEQKPDCFPAPTTENYNIVIQTCCQTSDPIALRMAEEIIRTMEAKSVMDPLGDVHPTTWSYNLLILAYANQAERYGTASKAEEWLMHLSKRASEGGPLPDSTSFNCVIKAWSLSREEKGADRALEFFNLMIKLCNDGSPEVRPDVYTACTVINSMSRRSRPEEAEKVLQLAVEFLNEQEDPSDMTMCFNAAINAWAKSGEPNAPERAEALLRDMNSLKTKKYLANIIVRPDVVSYTSCLEAIVRSGRADAPEMAEARLMEMIDDSIRRVSGSVAPNRATFDCVIRAWFRSDKPNRAERVRELFSHMLDLSKNHGIECFPNVNTANVCISAMCHALDLKLISREPVISTLIQMEKLKLTDSVSYISVINALLRVDSNEDTFEAAHVLERMHKQLMAKKIPWPIKMEKLYSRVIFALAKVKSPASGDLAYGILQALERLNGAPLSAKPTVHTYNAVIFALSRGNIAERARLAVELFDRVEELDRDPKSRVCLNTQAFEAILVFLANVEEEWAADYACQTLEKMVTLGRKKTSMVKPNYKCYDKCLQAITKCQNSESSRRAVNMLTKFVEDFRQGKTHALPSRSGFGIVMKCCMLQGDDEAIKHAEDIQALMEHLDREGIFDQINHRN